ncbi:MAG TPA: nucleotide exchange factor GrpE, partial [Dehalococcoidia bacterium]|nr:nucleotide exchange factor GrpE [Dehalococcoidia bacterium]
MKKEKQPEEAEDKELKKTQKDTEDSVDTGKAQAEEKSEAEKYLDNWKRTQADFINYKKRTEQEKEETVKFGNSMLLLAILPVLDDLQRALSSVPQDIKDLPWVEGIRLIERKFSSSLETQGVKLIKTEGEAFDPNVHEAALHVDGDDGMIVE